VSVGLGTCAVCRQPIVENETYRHAAAGGQTHLRCLDLPELQALQAAADAEAATYAPSAAAPVIQLRTAAVREAEFSEQYKAHAHDEAIATLEHAIKHLRSRKDDLGILTGGIVIAVAYDNGEVATVVPSEGNHLTLLVGACERALRRLHASIDEVDALAERVFGPEDAG